MKKFENKALASEAGKKSRRGKSVKTKQWELLGEKITNEYTERVFKYFDSLKDDKDFYQAYLNILEYFRPKLQRTELSGENGVVNIHLTPLKFFKTDEGDTDK